MRYQPFALTGPAFEARLRQLETVFHKWDTYVRGRCTVARGALVLSREEHGQIVAASESLARIAAAARARLSKDGLAATALGLSPEAARLARRPFRGPLITRYDFFRTDAGWRVSEFNDDAPGGYNDALGLPALFCDVAPPTAGVAGDLPQSLPAALRDGGQPVGFVYATAYSEDLQVVRLLADLLEAEGAQTRLASPASLSTRSGVALLDDEPVGRLYRFFPTEWFPLLPNLDAWLDDASARVPVVNPFSSAWTQSKAIFAWLWDHARGRDTSVVESLLPRTRMLDAGCAPDALDAPRRHVLKPAFGRMGEGVTLGDAVPPDEWRKRVHAALLSSRRRPFVLQERFHPRPLETEPGRTATACVGAYVIDGRFAGYYSRMSERPVVNYDATNVLTLVEGL